MNGLLKSYGLEIKNLNLLRETMGQHSVLRRDVKVAIKVKEEVRVNSADKRDKVAQPFGFKVVAVLQQFYILLCTIPAESKLRESRNFCLFCSMLFLQHIKLCLVH